MIANAVKSFLNPATQQQMNTRIVGTLCACIAIVFVALLVSRWNDVHSSIYMSDGETVLKIDAANNVTVYKAVR